MIATIQNDFMLYMSCRHIKKVEIWFIVGLAGVGALRFGRTYRSVECLFQKVLHAQVCTASLHAPSLFTQYAAVIGRRSEAGHERGCMHIPFILHGLASKICANCC